MNTCAVCRTRFEAESPAVLFISAYGAKRVLCASCEDILDRATTEADTPDKPEALESLRTLAANVKDPEVLETLSAVLSGEANEGAPSPEEEADMEAVFDEIKKEEERTSSALERPQKATFLDYLIPIAFGVVLLLFVVWYFFFR